MVSGPETRAAVPGPGATPGRPSMRGLLWLGGCFGCGCLTMVLVLVASLALGLAAAVNTGINCVPSDFPEYPGAVWGGWGASNVGCVDTRLTFGSSSDVINFYSSKLSDGPWLITSFNRANAVIIFEHASGAHIIGMLWLVDQGPFRAICAGFDKSPSSTASQGAHLEAFRAATRRPVCTGTIP
jgi:hypothetical protein